MRLVPSETLGQYEWMSSFLLAAQMRLKDAWPPLGVFYAK
jgi:hypothetical protein